MENIDFFHLSFYWKHFFARFGSPKILIQNIQYYIKSSINVTTSYVLKLWVRYYCIIRSYLRGIYTAKKRPQSIYHETQTIYCTETIVSYWYYIIYLYLLIRQRDLRSVIYPFGFQNGSINPHLCYNTIHGEYTPFLNYRNKNKMIPENRYKRVSNIIWFFF